MFKNREEAAFLLVPKLKRFVDKNTLIIAIPRGGVVLGKVISDSLKLPLDVVVVKKIGAPDNPELAIGAVESHGTVYWYKELINKLGITAKQMNELKIEKERELVEREKTFRKDKKDLEVYNKQELVSHPGTTTRNRQVIVVDDGIATGATALCAYKFFKKGKAKAIIMATPVISKDTLNNIKRYFDRVVSLKVVNDFYAVSQFYEDFPQVSDEEVISMLKN